MRDAAPSCAAAGSRTGGTGERPIRRTPDCAATGAAHWNRTPSTATAWRTARDMLLLYDGIEESAMLSLTRRLDGNENGSFWRTELLAWASCSTGGTIGGWRGVGSGKLK